jgi:hypothetical protein
MIGMNGQTQIEMLIQHFESVDSITNMEAQTVYKIRALPRRIADLKERGYEFSSEWKTDMMGQRYKRYFMTSRPEALNEKVV